MSCVANYTCMNIFKPGVPATPHAWFLKIDPVCIICMRVCVCVCVCLCVCVCPPPRLLITSGVMWSDMDLIRLVKQVLQLLYGDCSRYC